MNSSINTANILRLGGKFLRMIFFIRNNDTSSLFHRYTRDTFLYRLLNHALRLQEIDVIWKFGFFIKDLHQQLVHLHAETPLKSRSTVVYRGQM
jgi:hypothetical protein